MTDEPAQLSLTGEEITEPSLDCEKYRGDVCGPAEYLVDVLDYEMGHEITVQCCQSCRDEFLEWIDPDKVRELSRAEKWERSEENQ